MCVKTAVRHGLVLGQSLPQLLDGINHVLPAVKEPSMYATLAAVCLNGSGLEYALAGHLPLLHYRRTGNDVTRYSMEQFPLELLPSVSFTSDRVQCNPGDVFALITEV